MEFEEGDATTMWRTSEKSAKPTEVYGTLKYKIPPDGGKSGHIGIEGK
jgi:hypothetical protein